MAIKIFGPDPKNESNLADKKENVDDNFHFFTFVAGDVSGLIIVDAGIGRRVPLFRQRIWPLISLPCADCGRSDFILQEKSGLRFRRSRVGSSETVRGRFEGPHGPARAAHGSFAGAPRPLATMANLSKTGGVSY